MTAAFFRMPVRLGPGARTFLAAAAIATGALALAAPAGAQQGAVTEGQPGGGPRTESFDPVIAIVNGIGIRQSEVIEATRGLPEKYADLPVEMVYPTLVDRLIDIKLIAAEGRRADLAGDPEVRRRVFDATETIIQEVYLTRFVEDRITERGLRRRYDDFLKKNAQREEVNFRQIRLGTRQRADEVLAELQKGADFERLAAEWSNDPEGQRGGSMGWRSRPEIERIFGADFANTLFTLAPGSLFAEPIQTDFGWHVVRLDDRRKLPPPSFKEVRPALVADWSSEIIADLMQRLRANADIQRFDIAPPVGTVGGDESDTGTGLPSPGGRTPLPLPAMPTGGKRPGDGDGGRSQGTGASGSSPAGSSSRLAPASQGSTRTAIGTQAPASGRTGGAAPRASTSPSPTATTALPAPATSSRTTAPQPAKPAVAKPAAATPVAREPKPAETVAPAPAATVSPAAAAPSISAPSPSQAAAPAPQPLKPVVEPQPTEMFSTPSFTDTGSLGGGGSAPLATVPLPGSGESAPPSVQWPQN